MGADPGVHAALPPELTSFVGRRGQLRQVGELLAHARLVTLTGPGGVGKTRLALRVARDLSARYDGGVVMVELAGRAEPALVTRAVAEAYGLHDRLTEWQVDDLAVAMGRDRMLLVLDDCEHLVDACASARRRAAAPHRAPDGARDQPTAAGRPRRAPAAGAADDPSRRGRAARP